jgi:hypothetical protein
VGVVTNRAKWIKVARQGEECYSPRRLLTDDRQKLVERERERETVIGCVKCTE